MTEHNEDIWNTTTRAAWVNRPGVGVGPRWERRNNRQFERNVSALIDAYRAADLPVIFFLHTDGDPGFERDSVHLRLMDFIQPNAGEPVMLKDTRNAFTSTTLQAKL